METSNEYMKTERLWQRIAWIAGAFSFVICVLIVVNFFQINRDDPVNTLLMDNLVERLNQDPQDQELREEIRALDLLARKAYFTNQWQIRTGGYLLLMGVAIVIIAMQMVLSARKKTPRVSDEPQADFLMSQKVARRWISMGGVLVVSLALLFAFLSHRSLEEKFLTAAKPQVEPESNKQAEQSAPQEVQTIPVADSAISEVTGSEEKDTIPVVAVEAGIEEEAQQPPTVSESSTEEPSPVTISVNDQFACFRGPGGNGIAVQKGLPVDWDGASNKNVLWKTAIPIRGFNSPILWGDRMFLTGADEGKRVVYALDALRGEILWTHRVNKVEGSPANPPEVANYTGHAAPTMATDGERVYAIFANGDVVGLTMDGQRVWGRNLGAPVNHYGYSSSLITYNNKLIVQYDNKNTPRVLALDGKTGETVWSAQRDVKISWASPVIVSTGNRMELILAAEPLVISYNPETGEEWWRIEGVSGEVGPSIAYADGVVIAVNDYSRLVAIQTGATPTQLWEDEELLSDVPSPVATKDFLIMPTSYGVIACYNTKTGEKYWEHEIDNAVYASPMISENKVYLTDKEGITHIFKADKTFESLGTPALGEKVVCTPAFGEGRIYLRGYDHVYCIGIP